MADMDVDLNIEADNETIQFQNFPIRIREYVAALREKDPEKCWPFSLICDKDFKHKDSVAPAPQPVETISLFSLNVPQDTEAYEISGVETPNGNKIESETATENADNITSKFTTDVEDDSDGLTLGAFLRKRKGVEVIPGSRCASAKKQKKRQVRKPRLKGVKRRNSRPEGSPTTTMKGKSPFDTHNYFAMQKLAETLCSVELEMTLAKYKSSRIPLTDTSQWRGGLLLTASRAGETKGLGMPWDHPSLMCPLSRNLDGDIT